ncbi:MAG: TatD family deoxyribonuclease [Ruminococcaceae bacterium]|nr:TatD family deoxyribonuclease [Oscillospiraceae bacterium]
MKLFDSHAHYFDKRLDEIGGADVVLRNEVFGGCVERVINVGTNNQNNILCIEQASRYEGMYAAVGIHPEDADFAKLDVEKEISVLADIIGDKATKREKKIVALGEIGLDYHFEGLDKALQADFFHAQMKLASELDIPVIIHDRDAHGDCFETVLKYPSVRGVFHSYSGSAEMASELIKRGWYISFSGVATFKNASRVREVISRIPTERLLIETDAPYLAPHPHRGKVNHSGLMKYTAEAIAEVKGITPERLSEITYDNASELFEII